MPKFKRKYPNKNFNNSGRPNTSLALGQRTAADDSLYGLAMSSCARLQNIYITEDGLSKTYMYPLVPFRYKVYIVRWMMNNNVVAFWLLLAVRPIEKGNRLEGSLGSLKISKGHTHTHTHIHCIYMLGNDH